MKTLRILHISDLHAGKETRAGAGWRERLVLGEEWIKNLEVIAKDDPPDIVCFTGDLAQSGTDGEYAEVSAFLDATLAIVRLGKDKLFVVPGNHDIARATNKTAWKKLRSAIQRAPDGVGAWMAGGKAPFGYQTKWRDQVLARQASYRKWLHAYGLPHLSSDAAHPNLGYRITLDGWPAPLYIIGLDSAWLAGDDNDKGNLHLTDEQIARLLTATGGAELTGIKIAMVHHPLSDLADEKRSRHLFAQYGVQLLLHGHVHEANQQRWQHPNHAAAMNESVAGCLYESDTYPNCMQVIKVELAAPDICIPREVWLRSWSRNGFWHDDSSHYKDSLGGRLRFDKKSPVAPLPLRQLIGREAQMTAMRAALLPVEGAVRPVALCCAIEGMPGVGKTLLAEQFIARYWAPAAGRKEQDSYVRLFLQPDDVSEAASLAQQLCSLLDLRSTLASPVHDLAEYLRRTNTLLLIENVDSRELAVGVGALVAQLPQCAVLVTARYRGIGLQDWAQVPVGVLSLADALLLLRGEAPDCAATDGELSELAKALGRLPLALHIAASHLAIGSTPPDFLQELRGQAAYKLSSADPADYALHADRARAILHSSFAISWATWSRQCETNIARREGLAALAHGPAADCGSSLGSALAGLAASDAIDEDGNFEYRKMCTDAARLSLVSYDIASKRLAFHPLLGEWLRNQYPEYHDLVEQRQVAWLQARLPENNDRARQGTAWRQLHAEHAALIEWLYRCAPSAGRRLEFVCTTYAIRCGPFAAWQSFAARMIEGLAPDDHAHSNWDWTLGMTARMAGDNAAAMAAAAHKHAFDLVHGNAREAALAVGLQADILQAQGQVDEALRIRREEELPVYEKLGDVRSIAVTKGQIADILQTRDQFDEALRIRREEELPVYEKLGDVRSIAVAKGNIADILQARGQRDEALRIRREEELPVYEKLGDVRSIAMTKGQIADILQTRGQFDEALRIRREEELPVYEKLGDVRSIAVAKGKIADILQARGQRDEALRIRREEVLPVFEKLGDTRSLLVAQTNLATGLMQRSKPGDLDQAGQLLETALLAAQGMDLPEVDIINERLQQLRTAR